MPKANLRPMVVFRPTVVLGLGGTGYGVLLKLKKRFVEVYGSVPPVIQLLSIDTTENAQRRHHSPDGVSVSLDPSEVYQISINNPGQVVRLNSHIQEWWPQEVNANLPIAKGAGQVRARGRLGLFARSGEISDRIHNCINRVRDVKNSKQADGEDLTVSNTGGVEVYIVGSIAGGTGSGMFLDIAYLTRNRDDFVNITGVLTLPRVFMGKPFTDLVQSNAYGALKEIEYFWHPEPFTINYGNKSLEINRSPFDLLFLIDSLNEMGRVIGDPEDLQTLIADGLYVQMGSQIGVDSNNAADNIKAMLSERLVKKRRVSYCSFGVASLTLPVQQYEKMQLEDSIRFISNDLLGEAFAENNLDLEADQFLDSNKLTPSDLLENLTEKAEGGQLRLGLSLTGIKFNRRAEQTMQEIHNRHLSMIEQQVAQQLAINANQLENQLSQSIEKLWQQSLLKINGLDYAHKFLTILAQKITKCQEKLQEKYNESQRQFKTLHFEDRLATISEAVNSKNPFGKDRKIELACQNYAGLVKHQAQLYLNLKRCDKAVELYQSLLDKIEDFLQQQQQIKSNLGKVLADLERNLKLAETKVHTLNPFEHTISRFDAEANRPKIHHQDFLRWLRESNKQLSNWSNFTAKQVEQEIIDFIEECYLPLTELSIDEVLRRSNPDEINQDLTQLWNLAFPLWRYDEGKIPTSDLDIINESCYYGTADGNNTALKDVKLFSKLPKGTTSPSFISTADPYRITLFRVKVGVPLFALYGIEDMEQAYKNPSKAFKHLHQNWDSFPDLIPPEDDQVNLTWFALALALKLIVKRGHNYCIDTQIAEKIGRKDVNLGRGRIEAYTEFKQIKNRNLLQETVKVIESKLDYLHNSQGSEAVINFLREYVNTLAQQLTENSKIKPEIKQQVQREIEVIRDYLHEIDPQNLS